MVICLNKSTPPKISSHQEALVPFCFLQVPLISNYEGSLGKYHKRKP